MSQRFLFTDSFTFFLFFFILSSSAIEAQNLVINPSFENITACPDALEQIENSLLWTSPTTPKADYFHECDGTNTVGIPANSVGFQSARTGSAYAGIQVYSTTSMVDYREYIQTPLISPLIADSIYQVSMYVSPADNLDDCFTDAIGIYFSNDLLSESQETVLNVTPVVQNITGNFLTDKGNWLLVTGTFTANGGENHLIIGNFLTDAETEEFSDCGTDAVAYYYIEDVSLELIPELSIVGDDFICSGETTVLQAVNGDSFEWTIEGEPSTILSTDEFLSVSPNQTTIYQVSDGTTTTTFTLTVQQKPNVNLTNETFVCDDETVILDATPTNTTEPVTFSWIDGSTEATLEVEAGGTYWVDLMVNGCTFRDSVSLDSVFPFEIDFGDDIVICEDGNTTLRPFMTDAIIPNLTYLWQDGSTNSDLTVSEAGTYSVTVSNECFSKTDAVTITTEQCGCVVSFPSAFSPNGDGINDTFRPASNCPELIFSNTYELSIYTRYGNKIFTSTDVTEGWDGTIEFETAEMKTYVWVATYESGFREFPETVVESGSVFLLR